MTSLQVDEGSGDGPAGANLRQSLSRLLDDACRFLCKSTTISKQFQDDTIQHHLLIKQEQAKAQCEAVVSHLASQLGDLQKQLEADVTTAIIRKEQQLQQEYDLILDAMKQVVKDCNIIETMLEQSDHARLAADAPQLIHHLQKTMSYNPDDNLQSVLTLDYVPDLKKVEGCFKETSRFGYIKSSLFDIDEAKLVNCQTKAFKNNEDILCLKITEKHIKMCKQFVRAFIVSPQGSELPVSMEDNQDGTMTLKYTPAVTGVHHLHVLMYNAHISGSPFRINVVEMPPHAEPATTAEAKKKQVNRSFLCELTRHITEQPPPKQYRYMTPPDDDKARRERMAASFRGFRADSRDRGEQNGSGDEDKGERERVERDRRDKPARHRSTVPSRADNKSWRVHRDCSSSDEEGDINGPWRKNKTEKRQYDVNNNDSASSKEKTREVWNVQAESNKPQSTWMQNGPRFPQKRTANFGASREENGEESTARDRVGAKKPEGTWGRDHMDMTAWPRDKEADARQKDSASVPKKGSEVIWDEQKDADHPWLKEKTDSNRESHKETLTHTARGKPAGDTFRSSALRYEPSIDVPPSTPETSEMKAPAIKFVHNNKNLSTSFLQSPTARARKQTQEQVEESLTEDSGLGSQGHDESHVCGLITVQPEIKVNPTVTSRMADLNLHDAASVPEPGTEKALFQTSCAAAKLEPQRFTTESSFKTEGVEVSSKASEEWFRPKPEIIQAESINNAASEKVHIPFEKSSLPLKNETETQVVESPAIATTWNPLPEQKEAEPKKVKPAVVKAICAIDSLPTYPTPWRAGQKKYDIVAKHIAKGDIVEGLNTHSHVQMIGGQRDIKFPIGVTVNQLTNDIIVCNQGANSVKLFDWNGQVKAMLGLGEGGVKFDRPSAVVSDTEGNIYVKDDKIINSFTKDGQHIRSFGKEAMSRPYGLSLTACGKLLTVDPKRRMIVLFERDGSGHTEHRFEPCYKNDRGSKVRFLAVHGSKLVVCDLGLSVFYVTSITGGRYEELGSYGRDYGEFNEPSGVTMDKFGNMLIADSKNDRIHVYDHAGNFSGFVNLSARIRRPSDIHLTHDGTHLLVSNLLGHSVSVFKLMG